MSDTMTVAADDVRAVLAGLIAVGGMLGALAASVPGYSEAMAAGARIAVAPAQQMPEDPVGGPDQAAIANHELMLAYERNGFTHEEAFAVMMAYVQAGATAFALRGGSGT